MNSENLYSYDLQPESSLSDYIEEVRHTLKVWLALHTDREVWASNWARDDIQYTFEETKGILQNNYFYFDWKEAALLAMASRQISDGLWSRCDNCGSIIDSFYHCDNEECQEAESDETELTDGDIDDLLFYFDELGVIPEESDLWDSLENEGFKAYQEGVSSYIAPIIREIESSLADIETALESDDKTELLAAVQAATQIYHVNGNVLIDYGQYANLEYKFVDNVRNNGLTAVFGEEEVNEFMGVNQ